MSSSSPTAAPSPTSPPSPPSSTASPPSASPPSSNSTAPPPATTPAPSSNATAPPPATPPATTPSPPSSPPPASSPPPSPATPSAPPPSRPSSPPPASSPPPSPNAGPPRSPPSSSPPPASNSPPSTPSTTPPPAPPGRSSPSSPSPPTGKAPPSGKTPPASPPPPSSSSSSVSTSLVVGVAVGAAVILVIFAILCLCCWRKKRRRSPPPPDYYGGVAPPPPPPRKENPYGGRPQNWQQNAPLPADHVVKIPPQPTPLPPFASHPAHSSSSIETPRPPLPPPVISSSGGSGSNYSGSGTPLPPSPGLALGFSKSTFTYEELSIAADGFSDANLLGQGGFGYVHKGMLPNGKEVAIKRLKSGSGQGEREFQAEVEIISRVHHKHLVSLIGYCISGDQRLLVYEYVPNNTLEFHLHGKDRPTMDWPTRLKIALGSAKGLAYLHEDCYPKIIHRDIKAANILLDYKFEPKVSDFGLAKFASDDNTHVSTRVMGTFGYLAPEYASSGKLTDKSDVFSFGVMLLEMITGRRPLSSTHSFVDDSLVDWARPLLTRALEEGNYDALIDPKLGKNYNPNEMACMIACAAACVRHSARRRPRMSQVVRALEGDVSLDDLNEGVRPGHSTAYASYGSSDYDSTQYNEDMKKFRKMALASQDRTVSGYSEPTSEYGLNPSASSSEGQLTHEIELGSRKTDTHDS